MGIKKPDKQIYEKCINVLDLENRDILYVGDGGSNELETANELGMITVQAIWFINDQSQQSSIKQEFEHAKEPMDVLKIVRNINRE